MQKNENDDDDDGREREERGGGEEEEEEEKGEEKKRKMSIYKRCTHLATFSLLLQQLHLLNHIINLFSLS